MELVRHEDTLRTLVKAALQVLPGGGCLAELSELVPSASARRIEKTLRSAASELSRLQAEIASVDERLKQSEVAQVFLQASVGAATRTTSDEQRVQLGSLLAKGLTATDSETTNIQALMDTWSSLDDIEKLIFAEVATGKVTQKDLREKYPETFGPQYFGTNYTENRFGEDMHRSRIDRLIQFRLLRPPAHRLKEWQDHTMGYQFENFIASGRGEVLVGLLGLAMKPRQRPA